MLTLPRPTLSLPRLRVPGAIAALFAARPKRPAKLRPRRLNAEELRAMGDLELRDLGIGRSEVGYVLTLPEASRSL